MDEHLEALKFYRELKRYLNINPKPECIKVTLDEKGELDMKIVYSFKGAK